jgi:hypothetical protein
MQGERTNDLDATDADSLETRPQAVRDWLNDMDRVSRKIAAVWPKSVSAQDVTGDVRGPW